MFFGDEACRRREASRAAASALIFPFLGRLRDFLSHDHHHYFHDY